VRHSLRSSVDLVAVALAAASVGIAAEWSSFGFADVRHWLPDLLTGWMLIGCGLVALAGRAVSRSGWWLTAAGFAWFAGSFVSAALLLHRGPLAQLVMTFPTGRTDSRLERAVVAFAYAIAIATAFAWSNVGACVLAVVLVLAAIRNYRASAGLRRRERRYGLQATTLFAGLLVALAVADVVVSTSQGRSATLLAYELALALLSLHLVVILRQAPWEHAGLTDLVVELGEGRASTLRDALARALGDPSLEVGYRVDGVGGYVDISGYPLRLPPPGDRRRVTPLEAGGQEVALLVHDRAVLDDPVLVDSIATAARLTGANARLQVEVHDQVGELEASRRRLLLAADEERRRLERRLHDGAVRRLESMREMLARARRAVDPAVAAQIQRSEEQLEHALGDLAELAAGLHPRELTERGLAAAVAALAERSAVTVELTLPTERLEADTEATVYFVCSEGLANVAKYSRASRVALKIDVSADAARVEVADNGIGGADPSAGTGLRGLRDRVEAVGGTFDLQSPQGGGTRLVAVIVR
jgi:signal transduction histidine kinase